MLACFLRIERLFLLYAASGLKHTTDSLFLFLSAVAFSLRVFSPPHPHFSRRSVASPVGPGLCSQGLLSLRLSPQLSAAVEEKASLQAENRSLKEKLSRRDSADGSATAITGKKLLLLQSQMEQLQEENYRYGTGDG